VVVHGHGFVSGPQIRCHFGTQVVPATFESDTKVFCRSPSTVLPPDISSKSVHFWVSSPGTFTSNYVSFTFFAPLFISDSDNHAVHLLDAHRAQFKKTIVEPGSGGLKDPQGLAIGADNNLYVASQGSNQVLKFNAQTGASLGVFSNLPQRCGARGIVQGPDGNWFVACNHINLVLAFNGKSGQQLGIAARAGGLKRPTGLAFGPGNMLYVVSAGSNQVLQYARGGYFRGMVARDLPSGSDVVYNNGKVYGTGKEGEVSTFVEGSAQTHVQSEGMRATSLAFVGGQMFVAADGVIVRFGNYGRARGQTKVRFNNRPMHATYLAVRAVPLPAAAPPPRRRDEL